MPRLAPALPGGWLTGKRVKSPAMSLPRNGLFIRTARFTRLLLHCVQGFATAGVLFPIYTPRQRDRAIVLWARRLLSILHLRVQVSGAVPAEAGRGCIIAANHISWLDIFVVHTVCPARFVAKAEIRRWPLLGWLCARAGTLFIERGRRHHTAKINEMMLKAIDAGDTIAVFPEGTTTSGETLKKFHSSLFQAAAQSGAMLVPAAIRYTDSLDRRCEAAAYVDDISLAQSIQRILAEPELRVALQFAPPIQATGKSRRELTQQAEEAIARLLSVGDELARYGAHGER